MHELLNELALYLRDFLKQNLPKLHDQWWEKYVFNRLTFQQQRFVRERQIDTLDKLDLACLLRICDQNWHELTSLHNMPQEARNWLKECQSIRNRWAHLPPEGPRAEDHYRDLDTIQRFLQALGAGKNILERLEQEKQTLLATITPATPPESNKSTPEMPSGIDKGTLVRLKAQPGKTGAVIDLTMDGQEPRYSVFIEGSVATYYASQIETVSQLIAREESNPHQLHAALSALQLLHPSTTHLYSLFSSRIQFVPYQFRPVLKLIQAERPRLLIADEVGVGKTIEAGLILKEMQARRDIRSVLVICPKPLVAERKWLEEMKRFDEQFIHLDSASLHYCIEETHLDGVWPQQYSRAILPYSLFDEGLLMGKQKSRQKIRGLLDLDPPPVFDLVIVDEAHHIRNTDTWAYRIARYFCDNAEAVVLLTATPIQLGDNDLFTLLNFLRPDVLPSRRAFEHMAEPNPHLNQAIEVVRGVKSDWQEKAASYIKMALNTPWGKTVLAADPRTQKAFDLVNSEKQGIESRVELISLLESLYTFYPLINRTRRRDIGSFTTRQPDTVTVEFTSEQAALYQDLLDLLARILAARHGDRNLGFMLTTVRRQIASCVFGLAPMLENMLSRSMSKLEDAFEIEGEDELIAETLADFRNEIAALAMRASQISDKDPKYDAFLKVIKDKQKRDNNKLLIFSTFRHSIAYLIKRLNQESVRVGMIHGDVPDHERREIRNRFAMPKENPMALDLLLSSEVGCEGLDYQFCDGLINYDLPWNPMRVEQRIGRIDRYGQKSETVAIYNFITPGTIDADIYNRCLLRIGVFRQALGGSEEILGRLTKEIRDIGENLTLSPEEQANRLQQLADNKIREIKERDHLEEDQAKLFGLSLPKRDEDMAKQATSYWMAPALIANLVQQYLSAIDPSRDFHNLANKLVSTLQLNQEIRNQLLADYRKLNLSGQTAREWERWLKGSEPSLALTFDPATAAERRELTFITPTHPLARQAALGKEPVGRLHCSLQASSNELAPGKYPFAIYRWQKLGLREDFVFQPVASPESIEPHLLNLLENAAENPNAQPITAKEEHELEQIHYRLWVDSRATHMEQVAQIARSRLNSLAASQKAQIALIEEQRDTATDTRIQRMRQSQIDTAERDFDRRIAELSSAETKGDIVAEAIVFGIIAVKGGM